MAVLGWRITNGTNLPKFQAVEPIVASLVNSGAIAADEALQSGRNGWQLLVFEGSGRFADDLSAAVRDGRLAISAEVSEIALSGRVVSFHVDDQRKIKRRTAPDAALLMH